MSSDKDQYTQHILHIIEHLQYGEATPAEIRELDEWYEQSATDERYAEDMSSSEKLQAKERMFHAINSRIFSAETPVKKISLYNHIARFSVAAAIFIIAFTGLYFYQQQNGHNAVQTTRAQITPGKNKAVLTLGNGKKISLTDASNGQIAIQSGIKIVKTKSGQLIYEISATADSKKVDYNSIEAPIGGQWQVILPDQSRVWLNALSSITYPTRFTNGERRVKITGEVYFEIAHNKDMPFRVESREQTVEVLGTHFNVTAYNDEKIMRTTLLEGSVKVLNHGRTVLLVPGQQVQVSDKSMNVTDNVDLDDVIAWKNGYFKFNENVESIMNKIARWYNVEVVYEYKPDAKIGFGGEISRNRDLKEVLETIEYSGKVHFKTEGRRIIVIK
jgi:transmembrane sensor